MPSTPDFRKLKDFLDDRVIRYNRPEFIETDPVGVPHRFSKKQDIEIAALFAAIFAWGNRKTAIDKSMLLIHLMDDAPHDFCVHHSDKELERLEGFVHRTFNTDDLLYFIAFLQAHYQQHDSLEEAFFTDQVCHESEKYQAEAALNHFYNYFFSLPFVMNRTRKHIAAPQKKSACKRLNMFLRWMVRNDNRGVDFGIWKKIRPAALICPLDVHAARVARNLHLLKRNISDWQAAQELTHNLSLLDPEDPVKYDFALFSLGIFEKY